MTFPFEITNGVPSVPQAEQGAPLAVVSDQVAVLVAVPSLKPAVIVTGPPPAKAESNFWAKEIGLGPE